MIFGNKSPLALVQAIVLMVLLLENDVIAFAAFLQLCAMLTRHHLYTGPRILLRSCLDYMTEQSFVAIHIRRMCFAVMSFAHETKHSDGDAMLTSTHATCYLDSVG